MRRITTHYGVGVWMEFMQMKWALAKFDIHFCMSIPWLAERCFALYTRLAPSPYRSHQSRDFFNPCESQPCILPIGRHKTCVSCVTYLLLLRKKQGTLNINMYSAFDEVNITHTQKKQCIVHRQKYIISIIQHTLDRWSWYFGPVGTPTLRIHPLLPE